MKSKKEILDQIKGGLIVSCQALKNEPLHSSYIMSRMAYAAALGGAVGIRANSTEDIIEIKKVVDLPVIGIIKRDYEDSEIYITPTLECVDELVKSGAEIIAMDATNRRRPGGVDLKTFFGQVREKYPDQLFMADCSCYEDAERAGQLGFDFAGTTLRGYTQETKGISIPDYNMLEKMCGKLNIPIIAEGGIWYPEQLQKVMDCGAYAAVIGTAITRPMEITKHFMVALKESKCIQTDK